MIFPWKIKCAFNQNNSNSSDFFPWMKNVSLGSIRLSCAENVMYNHLTTVRGFWLRVQLLCSSPRCWNCEFMYFYGFPVFNDPELFSGTSRECEVGQNPPTLSNPPGCTQQDIRNYPLPKSLSHMDKTSRLVGHWSHYVPTATIP